MKVESTNIYIELTPEALEVKKLLVKSQE